MKTPARDDQARAGIEYEQSELFKGHFSASFPSPNSQAYWLHADWPVNSLPVHKVARKRPIAEYSLPSWVLREVRAAQ